MNTFASLLDLVMDAAIVTVGVLLILAIRFLIRERRKRARKQTDPRLITLSHALGAARPNARLAQQGRSRF